ncbi:MAG: zinc-ribbon domain-containing protein [Candidatus Nanoarchaeia archaeon]
MFDKKKCKNCGKKISHEWHYCPFCGTPINEGEKGEEFWKIQKFQDSEFDDIEKIFADLSKVIASALSQSGGISIAFNAPKVSKDLKVPKNKMSKKITIKLPKKIEEPSTNVQHQGNACIISLELPGVIGLSNIEVKLFEQSIEIRAKGKNKGYFKLIPLPYPMTLVQKSLVGSTLKLVLKKI